MSYTSHELYSLLNTLPLQSIGRRRHKRSGIIFQQYDSNYLPFFSRAATFRKIPISCDDEYLCEKSIWSLRNDVSRSIEASVKFIVQRLDVRILHSDLLSWTSFPGRQYIASDSKYVQVYFLKSFDLPTERFWGGLSFQFAMCAT